MLKRIQSLERIVRWLYCKVKDSAVGGIQSIVEGDNITVDNTDPLNPVVSSTGGGGGDSDTIAKTIEVNLTDLGVMTEEEVTPQIIADYFNSLGLVKSEKDFYIIKVIPPEPTLNFDVTGNWNLTTDGDGSTPAPVTDAISFKTWLESGWTTEQYDSPNSFADVVVSDFSLVGGRLTANVTTSGGEYFALERLEITQVNSVSIGDFIGLGLSSNQITDFNPTIALPTELEGLDLSNNQITEFNPTIALPTVLQTLGLSTNQITDFNPTIALPTGLQTLDLSNNQITEFNPTIALPTGLQYLYLHNNQIVDWSLSEPWANSLPNGTVRIFTQSNLTSSNGTTFKSILTGKGYIVQS